MNIENNLLDKNKIKEDLYLLANNKEGQNKKLDSIVNWTSSFGELYHLNLKNMLNDKFIVTYESSSMRINDFYVGSSFNYIITNQDIVEQPVSLSIFLNLDSIHSIGDIFLNLPIHYVDSFLLKKIKNYFSVQINIINEQYKLHLSNIYIFLKCLNSTFLFVEEPNLKCIFKENFLYSKEDLVNILKEKSDLINLSADIDIENNILFLEKINLNVV